MAFGDREKLTVAVVKKKSRTEVNDIRREFGLEPLANGDTGSSSGSAQK